MKIFNHANHFQHNRVIYIDGLTDRFKKLVGKGGAWREVYKISPLELARRIYTDKVDILLDLSGLTAGHRLHALRFRPAPVQVTWCGYPATTGCRFIDFRIVDAVTDPLTTGAVGSVVGADALCIERLMRIDPCFLCYQPPIPQGPHQDHPPVERRGDGAASFASFNALSKITDEVLGCWAGVLRATPGSRLLLKNREVSSPDEREGVLARCESAGLDCSRVEIIPATTGLREHLECYNRLDVALDTFPYNGTTTTCEALFMGVPVVTIAGDRHAGRVSASLLSALGRADLIAADIGAFPDAAARAVAAARDAGQTGRTELRRRLLAGHLCDAAAFAGKFLELLGRTVR